MGDNILIKNTNVLYVVFGLWLLSMECYMLSRMGDIIVPQMSTNITINVMGCLLLVLVIYEMLDVLCNT